MTKGLKRLLKRIELRGPALPVALANGCAVGLFAWLATAGMQSAVYAFAPEAADSILPAFGRDALVFALAAAVAGFAIFTAADASARASIRSALRAAEEALEPVGEDNDAGKGGERHPDDGGSPAREVGELAERCLRLRRQLVREKDERREDSRLRLRCEEQLAASREDRKQFEIVVAEEIRERKIMAERSQAASRAKSEFLANMSHEIRTPINAMLGFSQILRDQYFGPLNDKQVRYLDNVIESGNRLLELINDILDLSRVEAGKIDIAEEVFDMRGLVERISRILAGLASRKNLLHDVRLADDIPRFLVGDDRRIEQILRNFIGNAVKFTDKGRIDLDVSATGRDILFEVRDTGIGISEDKLEGLFDKFYQVDSSFAKKYQGTGLGLAISKELVEMMEGEIWAKSRPGEGSSFFFRIPLHAPEFVPESLLAEEVEAKPEPAGKLRILLAEDDELNRKSATHFLQREGHEVVCAKNGRKALELLEKAPFDIVLMDVQMPEMDGVEAARRIRRSESRHFDPKIPIVALTAYAMRGDKDRFLSAGMDDYVSKPIDVKHLFAKMYALLKRRPVSAPVPECAPPSALPEESAACGDEDIEEVRRFVEGAKSDPEYLRETLEEFPQEVAERMAALETAVQARNCETIAHAAHKFIALFSAIYVASASKISRELQNAARAKEPARCELLFAQLKEKMEKIAKYIRSVEA